jgi:hypothetical protein
MSSREERIAENETVFRRANEELLEEWGDLDLAGGRQALFICECGDVACRLPVRMTLAEYESVRKDANTFAVVPGHDDTTTERIVTEEVVDKNERFAVVRKRDEFRDATEGTNPR